ncbi:S-type anion channel SLAH2-like [Amaranthus tricolor]|uniref:S-type anion channel SLAH2-like n=1 Tax=Amaranthus tricolor TaxID=29722 RepID=UPI00258B7601|nr:S-type anion channel SLAH2-like [Amaranthus tricolor]XP_057527865.1 S-type anion channel SLAH2-like [Amaranthus tricolor]
MENSEFPNSRKRIAAELPALCTVKSSEEIHIFDTIDGPNDNITVNQNQQLGLPTTGTQVISGHGLKNEGVHGSVSISMPPTPKTPKKVLFDESSETSNEPKYYSQPISRAATYVEGAQTQNQDSGQQARYPHLERLKDTRFDSFKTWSGKLERQISHIRGKPVEPQPEQRPKNLVEGDALPVDRYFDALDGPELDTLRPTEELMLPEDKPWPFLLRFPIASFGICLGVSSQAILWKTLANSPSISFLKVSPLVNLILWSISIALVVVVAIIYGLKLILYFEAVRREYYHPIRVNFFFAPFISLLFLSLGCPPSVTNDLHRALWYVLMFPFLCLELKIYGQWMSGGQRRLSKVANPVNHLSVVGNFVGALLGASMGLKEGPIFFFAVGLAHYTVLFVTLYQRLPTNKTLPKELHPVFFLFVAAPSVASVAWAKIQGSFDYGSRISYFIALFLLFSLAVRINFFRGFKFSIAWWAYTFPMTAAAISTIRYSNEVTNWVTKSLAIFLSTISTLIVTALLVTTLLHAFVFRDLFPNDIAIAICERSSKPRKRWFPLRHGSSDNNEIEQYLKFVNTDGTDLESSVNPSRTTHEKTDSEFN